MKQSAFAEVYPQRIVASWPSRECLIVGLSELRDYWHDLNPDERGFIRQMIGDLLKSHDSIAGKSDCHLSPLPSSGAINDELNDVSQAQISLVDTPNGIGNGQHV